MKTIKKHYFSLFMLFGVFMFVSCGLLQNADKPTQQQKERIISQRIAEAKKDGLVTEEEAEEIEAAKNMETDEVYEYINLGKKVSSFIPGWGAIVTGVLGIAGVGWKHYREARQKGVSKALSKAIDAIGTTIEQDEDGKLSKADAKRLVKRVSDSYGVRQEVDMLYRELKEQGIIEDI